MDRDFFIKMPLKAMTSNEDALHVLSTYSIAFLITIIFLLFIKKNFYRVILIPVIFIITLLLLTFYLLHFFY